MNAKTTIRKILFVTVWLCIGGGMLTLLLAAISKKNKGKCTGYIITLKGDAKNFFIDQQDVEELLKKKTGGGIKGELVTEFRLQELESALEQNTWIGDAELYFDTKDLLHITVTGKEPVARIFTVTGDSYYIDSSGRSMPLSDKLSARVPVFTGFPGKKILSGKDSVLLDQVRVTANYIRNDPFWMAQVAQVDITTDRQFEMIPVVGDHVVKLGNGDQIDKKFRRLFVFYQQILSKTGFEKYKLIDVQYAGQVIASRQRGNVKVDSVQLRKNVEKLLRQSREAQTDTTMKVLPLPGKPIVLEKDPENESQPDLKATTAQPGDPNALKTTSVSNESAPKTSTPKPVIKTPVKKTEPKKPEPKKVPKAVMPPKPVVDTGNVNEG